MPFRWRMRTSALLAILAAAASVSPGRAQAQEPPPTPTPAPSSADIAEARRHFEHAREEYGKGAYREAVGELESAHALDPTAKDLVFNLGVVHEKLSDIDDALRWFELYTTMSLSPTERERADSYIRRLEGAKKEVVNKAPPTAPPPALEALPAPVRPMRGGLPSPPHGRVDAATIVAASVAGAALIFGVVMAAKAEDDRPIEGFVTGQDGTYSQLGERTDSAHREAVIADIAFGVSLAAGITATVLYFARTRDPAKPTLGATHARPGAAPSPLASFPAVTATPLAGGGWVLIVQGAL